MNFWERLEKIDRRWVYLMVAIAVIVPFLIPAKFPVAITPETRAVYDFIEDLPDSSNVFVVFDYYPSTIAECEPMARTGLHHFFRKDCNVITLSNIPLGGPTMAEAITREVAAEYGKEYGVHYVNLGYKANYVAVMQGMGTSIESIFPTDNSGTPLSELPLMQEVNDYSDIVFLFEVADNATADYWVAIVNAQYGVPMSVGMTAVSAPKYYAFIASGQVVGILGGMRGAAEYEQLVGLEGDAFRGMDAQSMVHLLIIALVVVGNVGYFFGRVGRRRMSV